MTRTHTQIVWKHIIMAKILIKMFRFDWHPYRSPLLQGYCVTNILIIHHQNEFYVYIKLLVKLKSRHIRDFCRRKVIHIEFQAPIFVREGEEKKNQQKYIVRRF